MCIAPRIFFTALKPAALAVALLIFGRAAVAQPPVWSVPAYGSYPASPPVVANTPMASGMPMLAAPGRPTATAARGPLARLVRNANTADGSPPFALADQAGSIQRLVEPVPSIDLEPYVGEVVVVRHDSGRTILATQLELPPRPLRPMIGDMPDTSDANSTVGTPLSNASERPAVACDPSARSIHPVRFVDNDDMTVELMDEGPTTSGGSPPLALDKGTAISSSVPGSQEMTLPDGMGPLDLNLGYPSDSGPVAGPMLSESFGHEMLPDEMGLDAGCPYCGGHHAAADCTPGHGDAGFGPALLRSARPYGRCFADVQLNFLRLHLMEGPVGKLSEKYEFSPRFTFGFDGDGIIGGRVRYWIYDRQTPILGGGHIGVEMNVLDLEATHRFQTGRSDVTLAAGIRWAGIDLEDSNEEEVGVDLLGMTLAADAHTPLCAFQGGRLTWVYGGRLSILGGDWGGSNNHGLISAPLQDDNVVNESIYAGLQYATRYRDCQLVARLAFEIQNWHSDALSQNAGADSLGFLGPGVHVGATF